jgi:hypothetical protein
LVRVNLVAEYVEEDGELAIGPVHLVGLRQQVGFSPRRRRQQQPPTHVLLQVGVILLQRAQKLLLHLQIHKVVSHFYPQAGKSHNQKLRFKKVQKYTQSCNFLLFICIKKS